MQQFINKGTRSVNVHESRFFVSPLRGGHHTILLCDYPIFVMD